MGILDGGLQAVFGAAFAGLYLDATLYRMIRTEAENGDVTETDDDGEPAKVQIDAVTEAMKAFSGYTERSVRMLILQTSPEGVIARPNTDAELSVGAERWRLSNVRADPANTYWEALASPA